jgi:hypothetical protein
MWYLWLFNFTGTYCSPSISVFLVSVIPPVCLTNILLIYYQYSLVLSMDSFLTLILLMWRIGWAPNSIPIYSYIQQDATLHSLFISGNCSTCFGWYFHPSLGAHTTVSTASGICHTVVAICRYRGRVGTGLSVLWVAYAVYFNARIK